MPCCAFGLRMEKQSSVVGRTHHRLNIGVSYNKLRISVTESSPKILLVKVDPHPRLQSRCSRTESREPALRGWESNKCSRPPSYSRKNRTTVHSSKWTSSGPSKTRCWTGAIGQQKRHRRQTTRSQTKLSAWRNLNQRRGGEGQTISRRDTFLSLVG